MGTLYVVATPIGNLEDITFRAVRILKEADVILCEDTRVTKKLLDHLGIGKPLLSYHAHSKLARIDTIVEMLSEGKSLVLVSDAGTPGVSDPGGLLVRTVREELPDSKIVAVPGPSSLLAAISVSGMTASSFVFLGFLPHKKGKQKLLKEISESERNVIFFESSHRIMKTLAEMKAIFGHDRAIFIGREISKLFEENIVGTPVKLLAYYSEHPDKIRGEFVVMVAPASRF